MLNTGEHNIKLLLNDRFKSQKELDIQLDKGKVYFYKITTRIKFIMNQAYDRYFDIQPVYKSFAIQDMQGISSVKTSSEDEQVFSQNKRNTNDKEDFGFSIQKTRFLFSR